MKVIGVEVRFGWQEVPYPKREAKLIPLEIIIPQIRARQGRERPIGEVTFHTTNGDVTVQAYLPTPFPSPDAPGVDHDVEAVAFLDRQIERGV